MNQILVLIITLFLSLGLPLTADIGKIVGTAVSVHDGDTITVLADGKKHPIRLAEIDAPELKQKFGPQARDFVKSKVLNKSVVVTIVTTDKYSRYVGLVRYGKSTNLNKVVVSNGYAWWYKQYSKDTEYQALQEKAKAAKKGLWADPNPVAPWIFRKKVAPMQFGISELPVLLYFWYPKTIAER